MRSFLSAAIAAMFLCVAAWDGDERSLSLLLVSGESLTGSIEGPADDGRIVVVTARGKEFFRVDEIRTIRGLAKAGDERQTGGADRVILADGGRISGEVTGDDGKAVSILPAHGNALRIERSAARAVLLRGEGSGAVPEKNDRDAVVTGSEVIACDILAVTVEAVKADVDGAKRDFPRKEIRAIFYRKSWERYQGSGWFARVMLANRDAVVGLLESIDREKAVIFARGIGRVSFNLDAVVSINFGERHSLENGNILVGGSGFLREFDATGKEAMTTIRVDHVFHAVRIGDDRLVVSIYDNGRPKIVERDAQGKIYWEYSEGLSHPAAFWRDDNGAIVIADYGTHRVVEINAKKEKVWEYSATFSPTGVERMPNGNLLVSGRGRIEEVNRAKEVVWKYLQTGEINPYKARGLENGNILIISINGQVAEVTKEAESKTLWKIDGLSSPVDALKLEDGTVAIAEQGRSRLTIRSTDGKTIREIENLPSITSISKN